MINSNFGSKNILIKKTEEVKYLEEKGLITKEQISTSSSDKNIFSLEEETIVLRALRSHCFCNKLLTIDPLSGNYNFGWKPRSKIFKLTTDINNDLFLKIDNSFYAEEALELEKESLKIITRVIPECVPQFLCMGRIPNKGGFLITSYLPLVKKSSKDMQISLARKLAKLHSTKSSNGRYGFFCGTEKKNNE